MVDAWFENNHNPQKDLVQAVRQLILDADPRIMEMIKRQPTFVYKGGSPDPEPREHLPVLSDHLASIGKYRRCCSDDAGREVVTIQPWESFQ